MLKPAYEVGESDTEVVVSHIHARDPLLQAYVRPPLQHRQSWISHRLILADTLVRRYIIQQL